MFTLPCLQNDRSSPRLPNDSRKAPDFLPFLVDLLRLNVERVRLTCNNYTEAYIYMKFNPESVTLI